MNIAKRIKDIREAKKMRQLDVAEKLGIEVSQYNRWEKRGDKLTLEQIKQIADALMVTAKEILYNEEDTSNQSEAERLKAKLEALESSLSDKKQENAFLKMQVNRLIDVLEKDTTKQELEEYKKGLIALENAIRAKGFSIDDLLRGSESATG